jgi:hypothetical protein
MSAIPFSVRDQGVFVVQDPKLLGMNAKGTLTSPPVREVAEPLAVEATAAKARCGREVTITG